MVKEVSKETWLAVVKDSKNYSIFIEPSFLGSVAAVFDFTVQYYINYVKDKPVFGLALFTTGDKIKVPTHFIYSGLWWEGKPDTIKFRDALTELIEALKDRYSTIELRLPPLFNDIRPFQWTGFSDKINYTYTRSTEQLNFEYNIKSRVKKATEYGLEPAISNSFEKVWEHQVYDLIRFHFHKALLKKLKDLFFRWWNDGFLKIYQVELDGRIVGSSCILIDRKGARAYNLLISSANSNYHTGVHAALYNFIFSDLRAQGIAEFDLYGADIKGVADFKSSFGADLQAHYTVKYNRKAALFSSAKQGLKTRLIELRARLF